MKKKKTTFLLCFLGCICFFVQAAAGHGFVAPVPAAEPGIIATGTPEPTPTPTDQPSATPTTEPTPTPTDVPTDTPTAVPTGTPSATPTATSTPTPSFPTPTPAANCLYVPYHFPSIQVALDAAEDGDTVYVEAGEYSGVGNYNLKFRGKAVHLSAFPGHPTPVINCMGSETTARRGFIFTSNDGPGTRVSNLAVINGYHFESGAGMRLLSGSSPVIENCLIEDCHSLGFGGGLHAESSGVLLKRVRFRECSAVYGGGGAAFQGGHATLVPTVYRSEFIENTCEYEDGGGAVLTLYWAEPVFTGCLFHSNSESAILFKSDPYSTMQLNNCLFTQNDGAVNVRMGTAYITNCTFADNLGYAVTGHTHQSNVRLIRSCMWGAEDIALLIESAEYCNMPPNSDAAMEHCFHSNPYFVEGPLGHHYVYQNQPGLPISPNVNTGGMPVWMVTFPGPGYPVMLENMTTSVDHLPDTRFSDIGYHYTLTDDEPTPRPPPERPVIEDILGSSEDFRNNAAMYYLISAKVEAEGEGNIIDTVDLYWENFPTPWRLYDDGTHGDQTAADGRYSLLLSFVATQLPEYRFRMYVVASNTAGEVGVGMPYMLAVENQQDEPEVSPEIAGRHVWYQPVKPGEDETGFLWILAKVEHPQGLDHIADVRLLFEDADTGLRLEDIGCQADIHANDGYYGIMVLYNGLDIPEPVEITLEVEARDIDGHVSSRWPVGWKTR